MPAEGGTRLALYAGTAHDCPYLDGRRSVLHYLDPQARLTPAVFGALLEHGFRRSGSFVYRPGCPACTRCIPARIPVASFLPDRSQRRTTRRNADIEVSVMPARLTATHFALYRRYIDARHQDGSMANSDPESTRKFLAASWADTCFLDLHLSGQLVATAVTDVLPHALSAVYTFFDPSLGKRSPGVFALLSQIALARRRGLRHLYLGYWVPGSRKMEYKQRFRPLELWHGERWRSCGRGTVLPAPP